MVFVQIRYRPIWYILNIIYIYQYIHVYYMECKIRPSIHARDMMTERGISRTETMDVINKGAKKFQGSRIVSFHRNIEVVYRKKSCNIFIITVYRGG